MGLKPNPTAGVAIYNGAGAVVFTDLDLSATMAAMGLAAGDYIALLDFEPQAVANVVYTVRPDGTAKTFYSTTNLPQGTHKGYATNLKSTQLSVYVGATGIVEWRANGVTATKIYLSSVLDATTVDPTGVAAPPPGNDQVIPAAAWPGVATDLSATLPDGAADALAILEYEFVAGAGVWWKNCVRPGDEATDVFGDTTNDQPQPCSFSVNAWDGNAAILVPTSATGTVQQVAIGGITVDVFIHCTANDWVRIDATDASLTGVGTPVGAYGDLDLSPALPAAAKYFVCLKVKKDATAGADFVCVRTKGSARDPYVVLNSESAGLGRCYLNASEASYLYVETNSSGVIEWQGDDAVASFDATVVGYIGSYISPNVSAATHVSPRCISVDFDMPMRNNADLRDPANYTITSVDAVNVSSVVIATAQAQPFVAGESGGKPVSVYLILDADPYESQASLVTVSGAVSFYGGYSLGTASAAVVPRETY